MDLPLLTRAANGDGTFAWLSGAAVVEPETASQAFPSTRAREARRGDRPRMPAGVPGPGEQYRFHIDMSACIGCKCCVVACNEQNGNPPDIQWRRVAEIEGGRFPIVRRAYVSMGCNHCADPTCLEGCPVDAYSKETATGIVRHDADTCIGCQYCTWTCSYGVPQFNPERGVVGKCDMCHGRLAEGQAPACVSACPEGAIAIEIVNVAEWRARVAEADRRVADGYPVRDASVSTTRATLPAVPLERLRPVDHQRFEPAEPHWPLVIMTVLTQMSAGLTAAATLSLASSGPSPNAFTAVMLALGVLSLGLAGSTLHLGRPVHAYRALKMWRRSWLSREVVLFSVFAALLSTFGLLLWLGSPAVPIVGAGASLAGLAGVLASARIYQVASRPLWLGPQTYVQFVATMLMLGTIAAAGILAEPSWRLAAPAAICLQCTILAVLSHGLAIARSRELRGARLLLHASLKRAAAARIALLASALVVTVAADSVAALTAAAVLAAAGELAGRYLFFTAAVPRHMTAPYLAKREAA